MNYRSVPRRKRESTWEEDEIWFSIDEKIERRQPLRDQEVSLSRWYVYFVLTFAVLPHDIAFSISMEISFGSESYFYIAKHYRRGNFNFSARKLNANRERDRNSHLCTSLRAKIIWVEKKVLKSHYEVACAQCTSGEKQIMLPFSSSACEWCCCEWQSRDETTETHWA